jgi:hypothetical protein
MKTRVVSFARGSGWLLRGWRLFKVSPAMWLPLVFAYWGVMTLVSFVPLLGIAAATILIPGFSVGFMAASRDCERRAGLQLRVLFEGFRGRWPVQVALGVAYLLLLAAVIAGTTLADGGALARWMITGRRPEDDVLQSDEFFGALMLAAALYMPVMMLYWFAPVLGAWHSMGAGQALFYSFFASLLNWRAFLGYALATALVTMVVPFLVLGALLLFSGGQLRFATMALVFPMLVVLLPTLFASFYASYRDVFGADPAEQASGG